jgi:hypothetical protein
MAPATNGAPRMETICSFIRPPELAAAREAFELWRDIEEVYAQKFAVLARAGCRYVQCGFSSSMVGLPLTIDDEKRKLERMVAVAREVWH